MTTTPRPARITVEVGKDLEAAIDLARRPARQSRPGFLRAIAVKVLEDRGVLHPVTSEAGR